MSETPIPKTARECAQQIVNIIKFDTPLVVEGNPVEFHVGRLALTIDKYAHYLEDQARVDEREKAVDDMVDLLKDEAPEAYKRIASHGKKAVRSALEKFQRGRGSAREETT